MAGLCLFISYALCLSFPLKDNLKAVYQRARAHSALYNEEEARKDFSTVMRLDPKFKPIVQQELRRLGENLRAKHVHSKKNYWTSSQEKWEKKAQAKKGSRSEKKKEVKWADDTNSTKKSSSVVRDEGHEVKTANPDKAEVESTLSLPGNEEGKNDKKTKSSNKEQAGEIIWTVC